MLEFPDIAKNVNFQRESDNASKTQEVYHVVYNLIYIIF